MPDWHDEELIAVPHIEIKAKLAAARIGDNRDREDEIEIGTIHGVEAAIFEGDIGRVSERRKIQLALSYGYSSGDEQEEEDPFGFHAWPLEQSETLECSDGYRPKTKGSIDNARIWSGVT